jgi:hypothetical protein
VIGAIVSRDEVADVAEALTAAGIPMTVLEEKKEMDSKESRSVSSNWE